MDPLTVFIESSSEAAAAMIVMSAPPRELDWPALRSVLINDTLVNGLSYVWWQRALRAAPMSFVAPWIALTPVVAALVAAPQAAAPARWTGIGLVLLSVLLATLSSVPAGDGRRVRRPGTSNAVRV